MPAISERRPRITADRGPHEWPPATSHRLPATSGHATRGTFAVIAAAAVAVVLTAAPAAQEAATDDCSIRGRVTALGAPLPGVSVSLRRGDSGQGATSSAADGTYRLSVPAGAYRLRAHLPGFDAVERDVTLTDAACEQTLDLTLVLAPAPSVETSAAGDGDGGGPARPRVHAAGGFQSLPITPDTSAPARAPLGSGTETTPLMLPSGFGAEASADAISITGSAARVDRRVLDERQQAIIRGDVSLSLADLAVALGSQEGGFAGGLAGGFVSGPGGLGGRLAEVLQQAGIGSLADLATTFQQVGFPGRGGGPGGAGGGGVILVGGRGRMNVTADYTFGGSVLDAAPYPLRGEMREERPYTRQNVGVTLGGPFKLPGLYSNANNRSNFTLTYNGGRGSSLFDQYATVPTADMRRGDFSSVAAPLIDPLTGRPFPDNRIPEDRISPQALALLPYIPLPNIDDAARNYRHLTTTRSTSDNLNVRFTHNFTPGAGPAGGGRGGGMMIATRGDGGGGGAGAGGRGTTVVLSTQLQVRRSETDQRQAFATLGGAMRSTSIGLPVSLYVARRGSQHAMTFTLSRTSSGTHNQFSGIQHVTGDAGILGVSSDPFGWGLPALSFSSISGLRDVTPSRRTDRRLAAEYRMTRPQGRHTIQFGGDVRFDRGSSYSETYANGAFIFTGLYTSGSVTPHRGFDVADFLLGLPQQAAVQYGPGDVTLSGRAVNLYVMDEWRLRGNLTVNAGLRYELLWPFVEAHGQLVNLDVAPDFSGAAPVRPGDIGPLSGAAFPDGLLRTDANNLAPRVGVAWRTWGNTVVRGGYGVSYNAGTYGAIARQLASQPPFAVTNTQIGSLSARLLMENALLGGVPNETTNNYGVDRDYVLGTVQSWNVDASRNLTPGWAAGAGYTHTRGSTLDIVRAPNRDANGDLRIDGVQPFLWQTSEGSSVLHSGTFRLDRRQIRGLGGRVEYTLAQSRDNSPSIGGGGNVVAQNDADIDAEWGRSNFDQRHRLSSSVTAELPFGSNRRWLNDGGVVASLLDGWRLSAAFSATSGTPLTARVSGAVSDVSSGVNGALRADETGAPIHLSASTVDRFFNTDAFALPEPGTFGTSGRNVITGPGSKQLDAQFARDVRLGGTRTMSLQLRANNLLNMVNYARVDTFVNSPTFGQVLSVRPMRSATLAVRFRY